MTQTSTARTSLSRLTAFLSSVGAAFDVAVAVNARRLPSKRSLEKLGIDEAEFRRINIG